MIQSPRVTPSHIPTLPQNNLYFESFLRLKEGLYQGVHKCLNHFTPDCVGKGTHHLQCKITFFFNKYRGFCEHFNITGSYNTIKILVALTSSLIF